LTRPRPAIVLSMRRGWVLWACAATACAATAGLTGGAAAQAKRYEVRVEAEELEVDTRGTVALEVVPQNGFTVDRAYPATFRFIPEVGDEVLVAAKADQGRDDARHAPDGSSLRWEIGITARKKGRH